MKPGTEVAGYRIESILGRGGMGIVYEATQLSLNRRVALKLLSPQLGDDEHFQVRFRREGEIQAAIDHPHIVTVYEAGAVEEGLFLAMRLVRGGTLKDMIVARELEGARTLRLLGPIAEALDAAHEAGLTHRDVKPQNILVDLRERAYLADFGLTKRDNESALTRPGRFVGSIDYISPEAIRGEPTSPASDIYSLAAVLYECLAGVVPFPGRTDAAVLYSHLSDPPPLLSDRRHKMPSALDAVIARGMAKDPAARHDNATELIRDAERAFGSRVRAVITPPGPVKTAADIGLREPESRVTTQDLNISGRRRSPAGQGASIAQSERETESLTHASRVDRDDLRARGATTIGEPISLQAPTIWTPPPATSRRGRNALGGSRARVVAAFAVAVLLGAAGFAVGHAGRVTESKLSVAAANADVRLRIPGTWSARSVAPTLPGLRLSASRSVGPANDAAVGLVLGRPGATAAGLLPTTLSARRHSPLARAERVRVGTLEALRYPRVAVIGAATVYDLILAPTTVGTIAFACYAPAARLATVRAACTKALSSAMLLRGASVAVDPSPAFARALSKVVVRLRQARSADRRSLAAANTPPALSTVAGRLSSDYGRAAEQLVATPTPGRATDDDHALLTALRASDRAYVRLASAAVAGDAERYAAAGRAVRKGESAVRQALAAFANAGYRLR